MRGKPNTYQCVAASAEECWSGLLSPNQDTSSPPRRRQELAPRTANQVPDSWGRYPAPPPPQSEHRLILFKKKEGGREENIWRKWRYPRKPIPRKRKWAQEAPKFTEVGIRAEGEKSQSTGPAKLAELVKNSFCYWLLSWYLSSVDSQNDLPSLRNNQTQSPEKSIRIQN